MPPRSSAPPAPTDGAIADAAGGVLDGGPAARPGRRAGVARAVRDLALPWTSLVLLIALWWTASATGHLAPNVLPSPVTVARTAADLTTSGVLADSLWTSFVRVAAGVALGLGVGLSLGLVSGLSRLAERVVDKPVQMVRAIPFTALVPLFIIWFGIGEAPKILLVATGVAVPVYINTFAGVRDVDSRLVEVGRSCGLPAWRISTTILLPGALPSVLVGVRHALGIAWVALIVAETLAANAGIGFLMTSAREFTRTDVMLVCIFLYALLGVLTDTAVRVAERLLLRWRVAFTGD